MRFRRGDRDESTGLKRISGMLISKWGIAEESCRVWGRVRIQLGEGNSQLATGMGDRAVILARKLHFYSEDKAGADSNIIALDVRCAGFQ